MDRKFQKAGALALVMEDSFHALVRVDSGVVSRKLRFSEILQIHDYEGFKAACKFATAGLNTDKNNFLCSICLDEIDAEEEIPIIPCKHKYHTSCLHSWVASRCAVCDIAKCPMCNFILFSPILNATTSSQSQQPTGRRRCECVLM